MEDIKIETGIAPPRTGSAWEAIATKMKEGDSVVVTSSQASALSRIIKQLGNNSITAKTEEGKRRVWKMEPIKAE